MCWGLSPLHACSSPLDLVGEAGPVLSKSVSGELPCQNGSLVLFSFLFERGQLNPGQHQIPLRSSHSVVKQSFKLVNQPGFDLQKNGRLQLRLLGPLLSLKVSHQQTLMVTYFSHKTFFCGLVNGFRIHIELSVKMHPLTLWSSLGTRLQFHKNSVFMWVRPCGLQLPGITRTLAPLFLLN